MKKKWWLCIPIGLLLIALICVLLFLKAPSKIEEKTIEVMDLYCDISPYESMSYGDKYISNLIFEPLLIVNEDYSFEKALAKSYKIEGAKITVELANSKFLSASGDISVTLDYIVDYYEMLIRLSDSNTISNPGIKNISTVSNVDNKLEIIFNSEKPENILALCEKIGYLENGHWYGSNGKIEYDDSTKTLFITQNSEKVHYVSVGSDKGLKNDMRITNWVLGNVLADETVKLEPKVNKAYGFLTWGDAGVKKFGKDVRALIFAGLENVGIRDSISFKADSIYTGTSLYKTANMKKNVTAETLAKAGLSVKESLRIGVVNMGSFSEISNAITASFVKLNIPVIVETVELSDIATGNEYDLIYVRLERGYSPDITGLLSETGLIGKLGYSSLYDKDLKLISSALTWEEKCKYLSDLDVKMREDGAWLFLDRAFDLVTVKK